MFRLRACTRRLVNKRMRFTQNFIVAEAQTGEEEEEEEGLQRLQREGRERLEDNNHNYLVKR